MAEERSPIETESGTESPPATPQQQNGTVGSLLEATGRAVAPVARVGWRGARGVAKRLGVDRAVGQAVDRGVESLDPEAVGRATERVLDTDAAKHLWDKVLESDEAQRLVERVAEAPEVRAAITSQGIGLLEDLRRGLRRAGRRIDSTVERVAKRILRRPAREKRPIYAGAFSRLLALAIDAGVVYGSLLVISAAIALLVSAFSRGDQDASAGVLALGASIWALIAAGYLAVFWSGAGRTPGMSFMAIKMLSEDGSPVRPGQAIRRVIWLVLSALPFLLGFWGVVFEQERRGWPDRRAHTVVCYSDPEIDQGLV